MLQPLPSQAERHADSASQYPAFAGISLTKIRSDLTETLQHFGRLGIFEEYTKHDITHVDGLLKIIEWLTPHRTIEKMSPADWLLIVLSAYLHDLGLLVTRQEFERRNSTTYQEHAQRMIKAAASNSKDLHRYLQSLTDDERERFFYQEFVRYHHARRIKGWIIGTPEKHLGYDDAVVNNIAKLLAPLDATFRVDLGAVCESHHLDDIEDTAKYSIDKPYGNSVEETANVQYAAILLRTADLLHIARDRTPTVAYEIISPSNPISQAEWAKQNAVRRVRPQKAHDSEGNVSNDALMDTIEVFATFSDADGFFGLTSYLQYASSQIAECYKWASASQTKFDVVHHFPWRKIDVSNVEAAGFIASHFEFQIDQRKILDLLTGHTLYNNSDVVLRELVQNSIDAVRLMAQLEDASYVPSVHVAWNTTDKVISVTDNGTGMTQEIIESNFLRVGSSRYQDAKFRKHNPSFTPISRFGIGVLSAFMIGNDIDVYTVAEEDDKARHITLRSVHGKYLIRLLDKEDQIIPDRIRAHGTSIKLQLRDDADLRNVLAILRYWIVLPRCTVTVSIDDGEPSEVGFHSVAEALRNTLLRSNIATMDIEGRLRDHLQQPIEIREFSDSGVSLAIAVVWNDWFSQWSLVRFPEGDTTTAQLGTCIEGIRVTNTTPGYTGQTFFAMSNAVGPSSPRTNVARIALENTDQHEQYLQIVYELYARHVHTEINEMVTSRGLSPTKASAEAAFLTRPLVNTDSDRPHGIVKIESRQALLDSLKTVRGYAVECDRSRSILSLTDLLEFGSLTLIQSALTAHLEYVLSAIPKNASVYSILSALEISTKSDGAVLFVPRRFDVFGNILTRLWNPTRIEINAETKEIVSVWQPMSTRQLWRSNVPLYGTDTNLADQSPFARESSAFCVLTDTGLELHGTEGFTGVNIGGIKYLFPGNPMFRLVRTEDDFVDNNQATTLFSIGRYFLDNRRFATRSVEAESRRYVISALREAGFDWRNSEVEVARIMKSWDEEIFDIGRWERR